MSVTIRLTSVMMGTASVKTTLALTLATAEVSRLANLNHPTYNTDRLVNKKEE